MKINFQRVGTTLRLSSLIIAIASCIPALAQTTKTGAEPKPTPQLSPLLLDKSGHAIDTQADWFIQREQIRRDWMKALGIQLPTSRVLRKTEILKTEELPTFTRQYLKYQVEDGVYRDGYLLTPKGLKGKAPAIVVFHPTTPLQAKGVAGLADEYAEEKRQGLQLVARGYIVWCPRNYIFEDVPKVTDGIKLYTANALRIQRQHPKRTGMGQMVLDAIRAADFVQSLPNVDPQNIGAIGHSLGGKQVVYAAAFDDRYKAVVSSEGGIGLTFSNWEAVWYLGPQIKDPNWKLENHQVLSLIAPRAFFLLAGDSADDARSGAFIEAARSVYKLLGAEKNIDWLDHHQGHRYGPDARKTAEEFLDAHLKTTR